MVFLVHVHRQLNLHLYTVEQVTGLSLIYQQQNRNTQIPIMMSCSCTCDGSPWRGLFYLSHWRGFISQNTCDFTTLQTSLWLKWMLARVSEKRMFVIFHTFSNSDTFHLFLSLFVSLPNTAGIKMNWKRSILFIIYQAQCVNRLQLKSTMQEYPPGGSNSKELYLWLGHAYFLTGSDRLILTRFKQPTNSLRMSWINITTSQFMTCVWIIQ